MKRMNIEPDGCLNCFDCGAMMDKTDEFTSEESFEVVFDCPKCDSRYIKVFCESMPHKITDVEGKTVAVSIMEPDQKKE